MNLTVIVSYYKAIDNLKLILDGLNRQSVSDFEVIISEDDANSDTIKFIEENQEHYTYDLLHVNQEIDDGFRKNSMLNKSIKASNSENLVFIDGDCIPHKHFVKEYIKHIQEGFILWGRRVMLGEKISNKIAAKKTIATIGFLDILFSDSKKVKEGIYTPNFKLTSGEKGRGVKGCNWGIKKQHLVAINGFDEDYILAAVGEDTDIEWRLRKLDLKMKSMKNKAIVYHMFHLRGYSDEGVQKNLRIMENKQAANTFVCLNGLEKLNKA